MIRGKLKKRKKYSSVMIIPHSSGEVKTVRFSAFYFKLAGMIGMLMIVVLCMGIMINTIWKENRKLKENISQLLELTTQQKELLDSKSLELQAIKNRENNLDKILQEYADKYREITENYISMNTGGSLASRSGDRSPSSFSADINDLKRLLDSLSEINSSAEGYKVDLSDAEEKLRKYLDAIPTFWPASGRRNDGFGYRKDPFTGKKTFHEGLDISASSGTPIKASASGVVEFAGKKGGYGNCVIINHGNGIKTLYAHASKLLVKEGQKVQKGDTIANVGSTGRSTGPHLHFEVHVGGTPVDPLKYLE